MHACKTNLEDGVPEQGEMEREPPKGQGQHYKTAAGRDTLIAEQLWP
jgi:hypothetical protein